MHNKMMIKSDTWYKCEIKGCKLKAIWIAPYIHMPNPDMGFAQYNGDNGDVDIKSIKGYCTKHKENHAKIHVD